MVDPLNSANVPNKRERKKFTLKTSPVAENEVGQPPEIVVNLTNAVAVAAKAKMPNSPNLTLRREFFSRLKKDDELKVNGTVYHFNYLQPGAFFLYVINPETEEPKAFRIEEVEIEVNGKVLVNDEVLDIKKTYASAYDEILDGLENEKMVWELLDLNEQPRRKQRGIRTALAA